jgi:hypothetical protein
MERNAMLGELVGQGELRRSIGMVSLISVLSPFSFLLRFMACLQGLTQAGSLYEKKKAPRASFVFYLRG